MDWASPFQFSHSGRSSFHHEVVHPSSKRALQRLTGGSRDKDGRSRSQYSVDTVPRGAPLPPMMGSAVHPPTPHEKQLSLFNPNSFDSLVKRHRFATRPDLEDVNVPQACVYDSMESTKLLYVGVTLRRPNSEISWGMFLSLFEGAFLVVGRVRNTVNSMTTWARVVPSKLYDPSTSQDFFQAAILGLPVEPNSPAQILPGDTIVSVNGRAVSSFDSLPMVTHYLRQCSSLSIVAIRHKGALQRAQAILNEFHFHPDRAFFAADAAFQACRSSLHASSLVTGMNFKFAHTCTGPQGLKQMQKQLKTLHRTDAGRSIAEPGNAFNLPNGHSSSSTPMQNGTGEHALALLGLQFVPQPSITKDFHSWLRYKKETWKNLRGREKKTSASASPLISKNAGTWNKFPNGMLKLSAVGDKRQASGLFHDPWRWTNPLFLDENGNEMVYSDSSYEFDPEDGSRAKHFLVPVDTQSFPVWLARRKKSWRKNWTVYELDDGNDSNEDLEEERTVAVNFWSPRYSAFEHWLAESTTKWKRSYSWNQRKRRRIEQESEEVVHFPSSVSNEPDAQLRRWLRVRKNQWRIQRRKRQRRREEEKVQVLQERNLSAEEEPQPPDEVATAERASETQGQASPRSIVSLKLCTVSKSSEMFCIDALLEEEERRRQAFEERPCFDISFIFDARIGAPDDVIAHCLQFLHPSEHGLLLCISSETSQAIKQRNHMWRQLCPPHWSLPRRPRKPWHKLYIRRIRAEEMAARKRSDEVLRKSEAILEKGDNLHQIQKLVNGSQKRFGFDVNYVSGVVCERNGLLNLAVISGRHKTVRWLVESKKADLESCDRGSFTPLINAAWEGDKYLVRFLLGKGADRTKIGFGHYSKPLAPPEFKGLNAEGWARDRGHLDIAKLIELGLG